MRETVTKMALALADKDKMDLDALAETLVASCYELTEAAASYRPTEWVQRVGALKPTIQAMRMFPDHMDVQQRCSLALGAMSRYDGHLQEQAGNLGAVELMVSTTRRWSEPSDQLQLGPSTGSLLDACPLNRQRWASAGGIEQNLALIRAHYKDEAAVLSACSCLSAGVDARHVNAFVKEEGVELLLRVWKDYASFYHIREKISQTFLAVTQYSMWAKAYLAERGYYDMLVWAMSGEYADLRLGYFACETMNELLHNAPSLVPSASRSPLLKSVRDQVAAYTFAVEPRTSAKHEKRSTRIFNRGLDQIRGEMIAHFPLNTSCRKVLSYFGQSKSVGEVCPCESVLQGACYGGSSCLETVRPENDVAIVVAHCRSRIQFLDEMSRAIRDAGLQLTSVTIVSKCGVQDVLTAVLDPNVRKLTNVIRMANVGRCDHSWAAYIHGRYNELPSRLIMVKDSWDQHNYARRLNATLLVRSTSLSFECAYHYEDMWHSAAATRSFRIERYNKSWDQAGHGNATHFRAVVRPLGAWMQSVGLSRTIDSERFWPVCYGGGFVTTRSAVQRTPRQVWKQLESSMSRGENIEESHYMERTWASLFTQPLPSREEEALACVTKTAFTSHRADSTLGALSNCPCAQVKECKSSSMTAAMPTSKSSLAHRGHGGRLHADRQWSRQRDLGNNATCGTDAEQHTDDGPALSQLQQAIALGKYSKVQHLLDRGASVTEQAYACLMPLHLAVMAGHRDIAALLLDKGAPLHAVDNKAATPLHFAAWKGDRDIAKMLISRGASLELATQGGATPLHAAASNGHFEVAEHLIAKGAPLEMTDLDGNTPLHVAHRNGHFKIVQLLRATAKARDTWAHIGRKAQGHGQGQGHLGTHRPQGPGPRPRAGTPGHTGRKAQRAGGL